MDNQDSVKSLHCVVVTPEKAFLDETVDFVAVPMLDGELGVLPGRMPLIGRLGFGELRTVRSQSVHRYFIDGGFVQVRGNTVTLLTARAVKAEEIKLDAAQKDLATALALTVNPGTQDAQLKAQERARALIRVAGHVNPGDSSH
jgi:F-type H+-transporting ATPase subunit epsilon